MIGHRKRTDGKLERLRAVEPFHHLRARELATIGRTADLIRRTAGTRLIEEGRRGTECFVVLDGEASVTVGGEEVARLGRGAVVGEIAILDRVPRTASVTAVGDVELAVFDPRSLERALGGVPSFDGAVRAVASSRR